MPTPTSQGRPAKSRTSTPAEAIAAISRGSVKSAELIALSDLGKADARLFADAWSGVPEKTRAAVIRRLNDLAENDFTLTFSRVYRIAIEDPSPVVRQLAIAGLWEDEAPDLIPIFVAIMQTDQSADVRAEATVALSHFSQLAVIEEIEGSEADAVRVALSDAARSPDQSSLVRRRAMESLAVFGDDADVDDLIDAAYDSDDAATRASAVFAMGRTSDRRWLPTIVTEFESPDAELRFEAARASGELGDTDAVSGLRKLLHDDDTDVRQAAVSALGAIGGQSALSVLVDYLDVCPEGDRELVEEAILEADVMTNMGDLP